MSRIAIPTLEDAPAASRPLLSEVERQLGSVPNLFRLVGLSPAALEGMLGLGGAVERALDAKSREGIALAVAEVNGCDYCLSAHSYLARHVARLDPTEILANRHGRSADAGADALVRFARQVALTRGKIDDLDIAAARRAGLSDARIVEIVAAVAFNFLTNFVNNVAQTEIDFPVVRSAAS